MSCKYTIFIKTSKSKKIFTFVVKPLNNNSFSKGVVDELNEYEITRIPCLNEKKWLGFEDSNVNELKIVVPMTQNIKCLVPDFGFSGLLLNSIVGSELKTKVRVVSTRKCSFSFPALMTFDKENCTACLEILVDAELMRCLRKGFAYLYPDLSECDSSKFFSYLTSLRNFNVVGVIKCTETVLFSFDICYLHYKKSTYDLKKENQKHSDSDDEWQSDNKESKKNDSKCNEPPNASLKVVTTLKDYCYEFTVRSINI
jgi:hypothetical protein